MSRRAPRPFSPLRRWRNRLLLAAASGAVALVLAEAGLRIWHWLGAGDELARWRAQSADQVALTDGRPVRLGEMVRPAEHPDIVYELLPDLNVSFCGYPVQTGARGFRGGDPPAQKGEHEYRIVAIGDSVTFGSSVATDETFVADTARLLHERHPGTVVTAVNTGVPGYNTTMEVATLEQKCLDLAPDLVIVGFVENDFDLPNFLLLPPDPLRTDRLELYELLYRAMRRGRRPNGPLEAAPMRDKHFFVGDPARVPAQYRHMVGEASYRSALAHLQQLGVQHHFEVLVTCHTEMPETARRICDELRLPVVTAAERQRRWLDEHHQTLMQSELVVSPDDAHPSAIGHRMLADEIVAFVEQRHWM